MRPVPLKRLCTRLLAILSLALIIGGLVAPAASAGDRWTDLRIDAMMTQWAETCTQNGGQATVSYDFGTNGHLNWASLNCHNQTGAWGKSWNCIIYDEELFWSCSPGLTRPQETPVQSTEAGPGGIVGAVDTPGPVSPVQSTEASPGTVVEAIDTGSESTPTPIVLDRAADMPDAPERPIADPATSSTDEKNEREP